MWRIFLILLLIHGLPFLDECLDLFAIPCLEQPDTTLVDPAHPPSALLAFLAHTQVSYDASYISPDSAPPPSAHRQSAVTTTAHGVPQTTKRGRRRRPPCASEQIPADDAESDARDDGAGLQVRARGGREARVEDVGLGGGGGSGRQGETGQQRAGCVCAAVGRRGAWGWRVTGCASMSVRAETALSLPLLIIECFLFVVFLSFAMCDPLLCLTASITVRERPVCATPARAVLAAMLKGAGGLPESQPSPPTQSFNDEIEKSYHGLDEVNLLWGLSSGTRVSFYRLRCTQRI